MILSLVEIRNRIVRLLVFWLFCIPLSTVGFILGSHYQWASLTKKDEEEVLSSLRKKHD